MKIDNLTEQQAKDLLKKLIKILDELDCEDYFGTEGWKNNWNIDMEI